jgi:hypothetical protein
MPNKGGKSNGEVSAGIHSNVAKSTRRKMRSDYLASNERLLNQRRAFDSGKHVMVTIANPNQSETNKPYIRVPAKTVWRSNKWQPK